MLNVIKKKLLTMQSMIGDLYEVYARIEAYWNRRTRNFLLSLTCCFGIICKLNKKCNYDKYKHNNISFQFISFILYNIPGHEGEQIRIRRFTMKMLIDCMQPNWGAAIYCKVNTKAELT